MEMMLCPRCLKVVPLGKPHVCEPDDTSLRDRFAMAALSGNLSSLPVHKKDIAERVYEIADAMMAAREE